MAVTQTQRFELYRWSSGADQFLRSQMDLSHQKIEDLAAGFLQGTQPAAAPQYTGFFHWDGVDLSYCDGSDWNYIRRFGDVDNIDGIERTGSLLSVSRSDHTHGIDDSTIVTRMIADLNVTTVKLNDLAVTTVKLADGAVTDAKLGADLDAGKLTAGTIPAARIGTSAITTTKINNSAVTTAKLASSAVTTDKIENGAVTSDKLATLDGFLSLGNITVGPSGQRTTLSSTGEISTDSTISALSSITSGNWFVSTGSTGWRNSTHNGGWYMDESTTIKAYSDKNVSTGGSISATAGFFKDGVETSYSGHVHDYLSASGGTVNGDVTIGGTNKNLYIRDSVNNTHTVKFATQDLLANRTITFPNADGTVSLEGHIHDDRYYTETETNNLLNARLALTGGTVTGTTRIGGSGQYLRIGDSINNSHYTQFATDDLTANRTITFPNTSGRVSLEGHNHDERYYTETEVDGLIGGRLGNSGRQEIHSAALSGTSPGTGSLQIDYQSSSGGDVSGEVGTSLVLWSRQDTGARYAIQLRAARNVLFFRDENHADTVDIDLDAIGYNALNKKSSREIKHDINDLTISALGVISNLRPVTFIYNSDASNKTNIGFIAEEVSDVLPLASVTTANGINGYDPEALLAIAIKSIKELQDQIADLRTEVDLLSK